MVVSKISINTKKQIRLGRIGKPQHHNTQRSGLPPVPGSRYFYWGEYPNKNELRLSTLRLLTRGITIAAKAE
jgi:hypothetical protein